MNICLIPVLDPVCSKIVYKKELVDWTIEAAKKSNVCDQIFIFTNNDNFFKLKKKYSVEVTLIKDTLSIYKHYLKFIETAAKKCNINKVILLSPLFPLRNKLDINSACFLLDKEPEIDSVVSASKVGSSYDLLDLGHHTKDSPTTVKHYSSDIYQANEAVCVSKHNSFLKYRDFRGGNFITYNMNKISSIRVENSQDITIAEALFEWQNT